jgi:tRNA modification GTPase
MIETEHASIIAQCTPSGSGAIALLRISGTDAVVIADRMSQLPDNKQLLACPSHTIEYGWVVDENGTKIDQVLFLIMHAPKTFTGEHTVEITCHNNPFLIETIINRALMCSARVAQPGEFTRRAFLNGKIDLLQAEAINELIHATNQLSLKQSLEQLNGTFSHWIASLEKKLITCLAYSEASFEFLDEEMEFAPFISEQLAQILESIARIKLTFDQQQQLRQGVRIALIGSVNAGKSSLFNQLLGHARAIVAPIAGTTRDSIESTISLNGTQVTLIDTAGLRSTNDSIEQEGIIRSHQEAHKADIILLIIDASRELSLLEQHTYQELLEKHASKIIVVHSKTDLPESNQELIFPLTPVQVTEKQSETIAHLKSIIEHKINSLFAHIDSPFLLNQRHFRVLLKAEQQLTQIVPLMNHKKVPYELVSAQLQTILEMLTELTGKTISENAMDAVFREFCVGK